MAAKFALITGASTGIGFELAHLAAEQGHDLLVVADEALIQSAAADFRTHGVEVIAVEADLSTFKGVDQILAAANGRAFDVVCANAGHGLGGDFLNQDPAAWRHVIDTNITGTVHLLQKTLGGFVARGQGKLLVTGSIAGYIPGPFNAVYNASKAFIDNFTQALRNELKDHEAITLTTLMPGATETEFFDRADMLDTDIGASRKDDAGKVARDGWEAMLAGKGDVVSGWKNKLQVAASGVVPPSMLAEQHRKMAAPGSAAPEAADAAR